MAAVLKGDDVTRKSFVIIAVFRVLLHTVHKLNQKPVGMATCNSSTEFMSLLFQEMRVGHKSCRLLSVLCTVSNQQKL